MKRFVSIYVLILIASVVAFFFLKGAFSEQFLESTSKNVMVWIILGFIVIGLTMSLVMFVNTAKELKLLETLLSQEDDNILQGKISEKISRSMIVGHLRKFHTADVFGWAKGSKDNLSKYLEEVLFYWPNWLDHIETWLPALGLLGTVFGMIEALLEKSSGGSMYAGVANAIGTTALALCGSFILSFLTKTVVSERKLQLKTILVILEMKIVQITGGKENV